MQFDRAWHESQEEIYWKAVELRIIFDMVAKSAKQSSEVNAMIAQNWKEAK